MDSSPTPDPSTERGEPKNQEAKRERPARTLTGGKAAVSTAGATSGFPIKFVKVFNRRWRVANDLGKQPLVSKQVSSGHTDAITSAVHQASDVCLGSVGAIDATAKKTLGGSAALPNILGITTRPRIGIACRGR